MIKRSRRRDAPAKMLYSLLGISLVSIGMSVQALPGDFEVTSAIEGEFRRDDVVPYSRIDVQTQDGIVTLTGSTRHLASKSRAESIAARVKGLATPVGGREKRRPDL